MALCDKVPLSIVDLNTDCLFEIFSYLNLSDVMNFRSQCSVLNDVVLKYLFPATEISVVYTEHENPEEGPNSKRARVEFPGPSSQSSSQTVWTIRGLLDQTLEDCPQNFHFRSGDFIVVSGVQKYVKFFEFVAKYIPNIKSLALIMDFKPSELPVLSVASELLKACPKVETLFLERIHRVKDRYTENRVLFKIDDLGHLLVTIAALPSLSELHFFARRTSQINLATFNPESPPLENLAQTMIGHFLVRILRKLRIFRINYLPLIRSDKSDYFVILYLDPLFGRTFEDILELSFEIYDCFRLTNSGTVFKKLQTLTLYGKNFECFDAYSIGNSFQQLKTLQFDNRLMLDKKIMRNLNVLSNLEKLSAASICTAWYFKPERIWENDRFEYENSNKTIKHIQVENAQRRLARSKNYAFTFFFPSLLTVTVLKPEVIVYEPNSFVDIEIKRGH